MKSLFEQMGGTYRQECDYLIPNLVLYTNLVVEVRCSSIWLRLTVPATREWELSFPLWLNKTLFRQTCTPHCGSS